MSTTLTARPVRVFLLLACGTALGLAGTDLVLPAIPVLPGELGGAAGLSCSACQGGDSFWCIDLIAAS